MKIVKTVILILIFTFVVSFKVALVYAWDDCPKGLVDDPYPGECARYIDTDNDGFCDHSQLAPEDRGVILKGEDELSDGSIDNSASSYSNEVGSTDTYKASLQREVSVLIDTDGDLKQKLLLSFGIVFAPLIGILAYVGYRKRKTN